MTTRVPIIRSTDEHVVGHLELADSFADDLGYAIRNERVYLRGINKFNGTWALERVFFETEPVKQLQPGHHQLLQPGHLVIAREIQEGDRVRLKDCRGPHMIVKIAEPVWATVIWFDSEDRLQESRIQKSLLVLSPVQQPKGAI